MTLFSPPFFASMNAFTSAYSQSDFFGKLIIWALVFVSIACWAVLGYKLWQAKQALLTAKQFKTLVERNQDRLLQIDPPKYPDHIPHPFAKVYLALREKTLEILNKKLFFLEQNPSAGQIHLTPSDLSILQDYAEAAISNQCKILDKHLFVLSTIATLAPFLGLLGTVWGILETFSTLHMGGAAGSNSAILGGISTALSTTVLGLVVAIPALVSYNYLKNNLKSFSQDMEHFLCNLLSTLELQYRKVDLS